ncbi:hypothetical protein O1611_g2140 [Lasiodiplodia mahajangana]|uniref:Uncharacterized protein n=1 Tax=Lasiodiplodia mahajangana TaxID=1108764 RepID=A0ACC2JW46_9PEZI|nr:hypothetical protein O1611_g2140 [Lasiodiplodia mahajangana]
MEPLVYPYRDSGSSGSAPVRPPRLTCDICDEESEELHYVGCAHVHCKDCIIANARASLNPNNQFAPARCCLVIPTEVLQRAGALNADELEQYSAQMEELTSPLGRLYCWGQECGAFIPSADRTRRVGTCAKCKRRTCRICRRKSHFGPCEKTQDEAGYEADEAFYRLAEAGGWKQCPNCLSMIQRHGGCNQMT